MRALPGRLVSLERAGQQRPGNWGARSSALPRESGWADSNRRPFDPQSNALTKLRYTPSDPGIRIGARALKQSGPPKGRPLARTENRPSAHGQPVVNELRKQLKSSTFRVGAAVLWSQLAQASPAAKRLRKHVKSFTFRMGGVVLPSQLA